MGVCYALFGFGIYIDIICSLIIMPPKSKILFTRCRYRMNTNQVVPAENIKLLTEISHLRTKKSELYNQKGPGSNDYITLSIKLNLLVDEYLEEKIGTIV
jgi:hypothetical protein